MKETDTKKQQTFRVIYQVSSVGITLVICVFLGYFIGNWLDKHFHTWPWLTLVFLFFGIVAGFLNVFRTVRKYTS